MATPTIDFDKVLSDKILDEIAATAIAHALGGDDTVDETTLAEDFATLYTAIGEQVPKSGLTVRVADGPLAMVAEGALSSGIGLARWSGWVSHLSVYLREETGPLLQNTDDSVHELRALANILRAGVWDTACYDDTVVVCRRPCVVSLDDNGNLHSVGDAPAIQWRGREGCYAVHGVIVPGALWRDPASVTPYAWRSHSTEVVRVAAARWGWDRYLTHMDADRVDTWADPHTKLAYELYRTPVVGLLRKQSPPLHDGSQPWYCEPVPVECRTARGARRWQVPTWDGRVLTVAEAESNPDLSYPQGER